MKLNDSPVTEHHFQGHHFFLKRDDLLHGHFNGNKARKFMATLEQPLEGKTRLIGWGSAQANSLTSLAALAKIKGLKLSYYVAHKPAWLDEKPMGNYRTALELGAEVVSLRDMFGEKAPHPSAFIAQQHENDSECLVIPEGGIFKMPSKESANSPMRSSLGQGLKKVAISKLRCHQEPVQPRFTSASS